jgi:phage shock protein A
MGILDRIKNTIRSTANAMVDKSTDPEKRVAQLIDDVEQGMKAATAELLQFKALEKQLTQRQKELIERHGEWEKRAMDAVRAGDDELAKQALAEQARTKRELAEVVAERNEQARIAAEMLQSRRQLKLQLDSLKVRQGTIAAKLAAGKGESALSTKSDAFERFERAENRLEDEAALKELDELDMGGDQAIAEQRLREQTKQLQADALLAQLKEKMEKDKK